VPTLTEQPASWKRSHKLSCKGDEEGAHDRGARGDQPETAADGASVAAAGCLVGRATDRGDRVGELRRLLALGGAPERPLLCRAVSLTLLFALLGDQLRPCHAPPDQLVGNLSPAFLVWASAGFRPPAITTAGTYYRASSGRRRPAPSPTRAGAIPARSVSRSSSRMSTATSSGCRW
jgi:hypothetical protein